MKEISVAILEADPVYGQRLSRYLLLRGAGVFSVRLFTEPAGALAHWQQEKEGILLAAEQLMEEAFLPSGPKQHTFVLTEKERKETGWNCPSLCRYRSGEALLQVLRETVREDLEERRQPLRLM